MGDGGVRARNMSTRAYQSLPEKAIKVGFG